ncbi:MAG: hypothetical protein ACKPHU_20430, partial [Planctomycetaceae bacterium]
MRAAPLVLAIVLVLVLVKPPGQPNRTPADSRPRLACAPLYQHSSAFISGSEKTPRAELGLESPSCMKTADPQSQKVSSLAFIGG